MITKDVLIFESGDGGELAIENQDLVFVETLYQQIYLALFGGNVEQVTKTNYLFNEQRFDYWGNSLFFADAPSLQFNSNTEKTLQNIALNSSGRLELIRAVESDLQYLNELLNYTVDVLFFEVNKIKIIVNFVSKDNQENKVLQLIYDNAKNELIIEKTI
jgi:hypothetical protein